MKRWRELNDYEKIERLRWLSILDSIQDLWLLLLFLYIIIRLGL